MEKFCHFVPMSKENIEKMKNFKIVSSLRDILKSKNYYHFRDLHPEIDLVLYHDFLDPSEEGWGRGGPP